jgi:ankyrin repeat protein
VNAAADDGTTALMEAARGGHTETVTVLLAAPGLDVYVLNSAGRMALTLADEQGHVAIASLLRARRRRSQSSRA